MGESHGSKTFNVRVRSKSFRLFFLSGVRWQYWSSRDEIYKTFVSGFPATVTKHLANKTFRNKNNA